MSLPKKKKNEKVMKIERFDNENGVYSEKRVFFVLSVSIIEKWDFNFQKDFGGCQIFLGLMGHDY